MARKPIIFWFGPYKGKSVEQVMFLPGGYRYLCRLIEKKESLRNPRSLELVARAEEVVERGENRTVLAKCYQKENIATNVEVLIDYMGVHTFGMYRCEVCRDEVPFDKPYPLPIKFSSMNLMPQEKATQNRFIWELKFCFFLNSKERITKKRALKFFFPEDFGLPNDRKRAKKDPRQMNLFDKAQLDKL